MDGNHRSALLSVDVASFVARDRIASRQAVEAERLESMELRNNEEEVKSMMILYGSLFASIKASSAEVDLPELRLVERENTSTTSNCALVENRTAMEVMEGLDFLSKRVDALRNIMDTLRKRLTLRDPVTDKPRYGEQTTKRVVTLLQSYQDLTQALKSIFGKNSDAVKGDEPTLHIRSAPVLDSIRQLAATEIAVKQKLDEEQRLRAEAERTDRQAAIDQARREQEDAAAAIARQEREAAVALARNASEARLAVQRALEQAAAADQAWVSSIQHGKSLEGVKEQLRNFSASCGDASLPALHTLFSQIVAHPEDVSFRRIRRDHPRFLEDIGNFAGGKELLIAAGFELGFVEEIPSFVCKEPDVEKDLDGWSAWFDLLKGTLNAIEQEMKK